MRPLIFGMGRWCIAMLIVMTLGPCPAAADPGGPFVEALARLKEAPLTVLGEAFDRLAETKDPAVVPVLRALLDGRLYYRKDDGRVVFGDSAEDGLAIVDVLDGEALGIVGKFELKKIGVNNALRTRLRETLGRLELAADGPAQRLKAVEAMSKSLDEENLELLRARLDVETDAKVSEAIETALALADLASDDKAVRIAAINALHGSLHPDALNR